MCKSILLVLLIFLILRILAADSLEIDQLCETPQRPKLVAQRKEQILSPISNGLTPTRV
jgi:hypothetical protein